jgi:hypothetical protein
MDLLKQQCETALRLAHTGRIQSIVFVTINNDAEAVGWAADWIKRVGNQKLGSPPPGSEKGWTFLYVRETAANLADKNVCPTPFRLATFTTNADEPVTRLKIGDGWPS